MKRYLYNPLDDKKSWLSLLPAFDPDDEGGGSDADEDDEPEDDADEGDESDEGDDDKGKDARLKKLERSLRRVRAESRRWKDLASKGTEGKDDGAKGGDDDGPDFRQAALISAGVNALTAAGYTGSVRRAEKLLALAELDDIEPDRRGRFDPEDFADAIEDMREEFPELFRSGDDDDAEGGRRPASRVNRQRSGAGTGTGSNGPRKLTSDEKFALQIAGQAGYTGVANRIRRGR